MVEMQTDPMEPPMFNVNKKIPRGPPSPPVPVLHSPPRKVCSYSITVFLRLTPWCNRGVNFTAEKYSQGRLL